MKVYKLDKTEGEHYKIDYSKELNEQQREVVFSKDKASLVLAGPGSGKTRVLVYKVAYLIESGVNPANILLLTFTNRAAKEMVRRTEELLGVYPKGLMGGTFHHIGNSIIRRHAPAVDLSHNFSIIDNEDSKQLIKDITAKVTEGKGKHFPSPSVVKSIISFALNALMSINDCIEQKYSDYEKYAKEINHIAKIYDERKKAAHILDFDDLLVYWNKVLDNPKIQEYYQKNFQHILVDEFQDTNKLQFEIIRKLTVNADNNIMAVGDDCQSIYSFRAAEIKNILKFPQYYKNHKEHKLEVNYRSTPQIMHLVNESIKHNKNQFKKVLVTNNKAGNVPAVVRCKSPEQEAAFIGQRILELKEGGTPYKEIGVLFRAEYQSAELELELTKRGIPFQKRGGLKFFEQAHIKDITAFLKIINNHKDELAWKRVVCLFPGIGPAKAIAIWEWVSNTFDPLKHIASVDNQLTVNAPGWNEFKKLIASLEAVERKPSELINKILVNYYEEYLKETYPDFKTRLLDVKQYINLALQYKEINKFLEDILLDADLTGSEEGERDEEKVILSTIHQAKGLEWKNVFVVSLAEDRFPLERSYADDSIDEERRLFYVACSRAKKELYLTLPMQEFSFWGGHKILRDSIFIEELPKDSYEEWSIDVNAFDPKDDEDSDDDVDFVSASELE